jgi:hypothetical protein
LLALGWAKKSRGRQKKIYGPPRAFAKYQTHPPIIRHSFSLTFLLVRFWAFIGKGNSKTPQNFFCRKKPMSKNFPNKIDKNFDVSFSSTFFCFIAFSGVSRQKKRFAKNIVSKSFYKEFDKKSKTEFFSVLFYHVFGRFSVRGLKNDKKYRKINLTSSLFRTLTHPPTMGRGGQAFCPCTSVRPASSFVEAFYYR